MSGPITRARLLELFDRLNEKLKQADQQGELQIVAGAMMALVHDTKRVTLDILLREAGVETRRAAVRLHELTYGAKPMAAEAGLQLIERYGRQPDRDIGLTR